MLARDGQQEVAGRDGLLTPDDDGAVRKSLEPVLEEPLDLRLRRERRVMVELHVRDDCDARPQEKQGAVGLVALGNEPTLPCARVATELRDLTADQVRGIVPEPLEGERDHRRCRRLSVRSRDDDRRSELDELREKLPAAHCSAVKLRIVSRDRRGRDHLVAGRHVVGAVTDRHPNLMLLQQLDVWRPCPVRAAYVGTPRLRDDGQGAHARTADPDEPESPTAKRLQARSTPRRRSSQLPAGPGASWTRTSPEAEPEPTVAPSACVLRSSPGSGTSNGPSAALEPARVLRLMVCRRVWIRDEQRGLAGCGDLPDDPAGARDDEIRSGESRPEVVGEGKEAVPGAADLLGQLGVVPFAGEMKHGGPVLAERLDCRLVQPPGAEAAAADEHHRPVEREIESSARVILVHGGTRATRDRPAHDAVFRARPGQGSGS